MHLATAPAASPYTKGCHGEDREGCTKQLVLQALLAFYVAGASVSQDMVDHSRCVLHHWDSLIAHGS